MAELAIHTGRIKNNIRYLSSYFEAHQIEWSLVTKVFSGDQDFLEEVLTEDVIQKISSVGDSRLSSLKNLRAVNPDMRTIYIKPPAKVYVDEVVQYADISLNSSYTTIRALNEAAKKRGKVHKVIIMIEMGELREGVTGDELLAFYEKVYQLQHIDIIGIGSNLGCMYGVVPSQEKLEQLCYYRDMVQDAFDVELPYISGGSSITLPLVEQGIVPDAINHFRVGEAIFFGVSPYDNAQFKELSTETFEFRANIIELYEKQLVPDGDIRDASIGQSIAFTGKTAEETSTKAILDFGMLDVEQEELTAVDGDMTFVGVTSDMLVVDLGDNRTADGDKRYRVGDTVRFKPSYMAVARLLHSKFIDKKFVK